MYFNYLYIYIYIYSYIIIFHYILKLPFNFRCITYISYKYRYSVCVFVFFKHVLLQCSVQFWLFVRQYNVTWKIEFTPLLLACPNTQDKKQNVPLELVALLGVFASIRIPRIWGLITNNTVIRILSENFHSKLS